MRKITLVLALIMSIQLVAQEGPLLSTAVLTLRDNNLTDAKKHIDEADQIISAKAESDVSTKNMGKFLYHKGLIYYQIFNSPNPEVRALAPDALDVATEFFQKTIDFENKTGKEKYSDDVKIYMPFLANAYANRGIQRNNEKDFKGAYEDFMRTYDMKKAPPMGVTDTAMLYNAALMAQNGGSIKKAIEINEKLIEMGFMNRVYMATSVEDGSQMAFASKAQMNNAIKKEKFNNPVIEGDIRADLYGLVAGLYLQEKDTAKFVEYIKKGRAKYPENASLLQSELQLFLEAKEYDKAMINLDQAIANSPDNKAYYYIKGFIYHTEIEDYDKAVESYNKALEIDPQYIEPLYMSGLIFVDKANKIRVEMNKLDFNQQSKYKAMDVKEKEQFKNALGYFEKVYAVDPKDMDNLKALREVYYKLKMREEAEKVSEEIMAQQ